jgi:hypothetical protein
VFAVFPRFALRRGSRRVPASALRLAASAFALYRLWNTLDHAAS